MMITNGADSEYYAKRGEKARIGMKPQLDTDDVIRLQLRSATAWAFLIADFDCSSFRSGTSEIRDSRTKNAGCRKPFTQRVPRSAQEVACARGSRHRRHT